MRFLRPSCLVPVLLLAACGYSQNDPYPADERGTNTLYSAFTERPKHLDPARSYSEDESVFTAQVYEAPLQYHYLKRPFQLQVAAAAEMPTLRQFDAAGKLLPLAVTAPQRMKQLPNVPTMAEVGHPELNLTSWTGLAAPAGTPEAVVQTLYKAVRQVATSPAMVANLKDRGVIVPEEMPPAAFEKMMADRMVKFGAVVKRAGITAE